MDSLTIVLISVAFIGLYAYRFYVGVPSNYSLLPYQRGILYKRGRPVREVGPGRYRVMLGSEKIILLDMRPIQVNVENRMVITADGKPAIYSFAATAEICDVNKAIYSSVAYNQVPAFVTVCVTRGVLNQTLSDQIALGRTNLEEVIRENCLSRLGVAGFQLSSFKFTQLGLADR